MTVRPVHWHEGMFLRPHHFQVAERYRAHQAKLGDKWDSHYNWGLRDIELNLEGLANYRLEVLALHARLRDGTLISIPEDGRLDAVDLKGALETEKGLTVYVAVPALQLGRANTSAARSDGARYLVDTQDLEDENTGVNAQQVQVRLVNMQLLLSTQDHSGYDLLPIARIEKSAKAEAPPELDVAYIPPVLACDGWKPLGVHILQNIYDQIGKHVEQRATQVVSRGIGFDSQSAGDRRLFEQLRILNEAYSVLGVMAFAEGVHPLGAYTELCRIVGQLSIFGRDCRPPHLPRYDHDDLGGCFYRVKQYLQDMLEGIAPLEYKERPFVGAGLRLQVALEPSWLEPAWQMFVGVSTPLSAEKCIALLKPGGLDMKIGSSSRADDIFKYGRTGLKFAHTPLPPRSLPQKNGLYYFQVDRGSQQEEWTQVQKELSLAIRVNESRVLGNIDRQQVLTIKTPDGQQSSLQFTLYIMPNVPTKES
jgi:type VI secretion system protein ImpJ